MAKLGSNALGMVRGRVTKTGVNAEGTSFPPYSTKPMLVGSSSFATKAKGEAFFSSKKKRQALDWVTVKGHKLAVLGGGYKQLRDIQGYKTGFVDFVISGKMWTNIKLVSDNAELSSGVAVIKATTDLDKKKLAGNTERKGEILALSRTEIDDMEKEYSDWVMEMARKNKLT